MPSTQHQWHLFFDNNDNRRTRTFSSSQCFCFFLIVLFLGVSYRNFREIDANDSINQVQGWTTVRDLNYFVYSVECDSNVFFLFNQSLNEATLVDIESYQTEVFNLGQGDMNITTVSHLSSLENGCEMFFGFEGNDWGILSFSKDQDNWSFSFNTSTSEFIEKKEYQSVRNPANTEEILLFQEGSDVLLSLNVKTKEENKLQLGFLLPTDISVTTTGLEDNSILLYGLDSYYPILKTLIISSDNKVTSKNIINNIKTKAENFWGSKDYHSYVTEFIRTEVDILIRNNEIYLFGGKLYDSKRIALDNILVTNYQGSLECGEESYTFPFCMTVSANQAYETTDYTKDFRQKGFIRNNEFLIFSTHASFYNSQNNKAAALSHEIENRITYIPVSASLSSLLTTLMILSLGCTCTFIFLISFNSYFQRRVASDRRNDGDWLQQLFGLNSVSRKDGGVDKDLLNQLPSLPYSEIVSAKSSTVGGDIESSTPVGESECCCICLSEFEPTTCTTILPCKHIYHKDCINSWLAKNELCPLCKQKVSEATVKEFLSKMKNEKTIVLS